MNSDSIAHGEPGCEDRRIVLPANATTTTAEELKVRLVLAADLDEEIRIDASQVESAGLAVFQLLAATRLEAEAAGKPFVVDQPSAAFAECAARCGVTELAR